MVWFRFINVKRIHTENEAIALLYELGRIGIAGGIKYDGKNIEVGFLKYPSKEKLSFLKSFLQAEAVEEVDSE